MLVSYAFSFGSGQEISSEWAYFLYGALMEQVPRQAAELLHQEGFTPLSQYIGTDGIWRVTVLGQRAVSLLCPVLDQLTALPLRHRQIVLSVTGCSRREIRDGAAFLHAPAPALRTLCLVTPMCFKVRGAYDVLPDPRRILMGLTRQWNAAFPDCPVREEDVPDAARDLRVRKLQLHTTEYPLKGAVIPGTAGTLTLQPPQGGTIPVQGLLSFAAFSGIGIKTALGMGGTQIRQGSGTRNQMTGAVGGYLHGRAADKAN